MAQCQAHNRKGEQCKRQAIAGKRVCRFHGGLTPGGTASPHFKHGKYSKYLPKDLLAKYTEASKDKDLLSLRDEIAVVDARLKLLLSQLDTGGGMNLWQQLSQTWPEFVRAQRDADQEKMVSSLQQVNKLIQQGSKTSTLWMEIEKSMDLRRRLAASEARRLTEMQQLITAERAMILVYAILDIIKRHLTVYINERKTADSALLSLIAMNIRALISTQDEKVIDA